MDVSAAMGLLSQLAPTKLQPLPAQTGSPHHPRVYGVLPAFDHGHLLPSPLERLENARGGPLGDQDLGLDEFVLCLGSDRPDGRRSTPERSRARVSVVSVS